MALTATEARRRLFPLIEEVNADSTPVEIVSNKGRAVLMSGDDYDSLMETLYLFSTRANTESLLRSFAEEERGETVELDLSDPAVIERLAAAGAQAAAVKDTTAPLPASASSETRRTAARKSKSVTVKKATAEKATATKATARKAAKAGPRPKGSQVV